jgi:hypothetical protein
MPGAYYLIYQFAESFEKGMLYTINSGGNNKARGALYGGIAGAGHGIKAIPERWMTGLKHHERYLELAGKVAANPIGDIWVPPEGLSQNATVIKGERKYPHNLYND